MKSTSCKTAVFMISGAWFSVLKLEYTTCCFFEMVMIPAVTFSTKIPAITTWLQFSWYFVLPCWYRKWSQYTKTGTCYVVHYGKVSTQPNCIYINWMKYYWYYWQNCHLIIYIKHSLDGFGRLKSFRVSFLYRREVWVRNWHERFWCLLKLNTVNPGNLQ